MSDEHTIDTSEQTSSMNTQELAAAIGAALAPALSQSLSSALAPLYEQRNARPAPRMRQPTAADVGLDDDDPYAGQFTKLIRELGNMKSENINLRDQVHNLGVSTMQNQLGRDVNAALKSQNVPQPLHEAFSAVIYSVLQSGQQTTPEAVANNLMRGVTEYGDQVRKGVAEQAAMPKPPTFRGQELGPEMPAAETMEEAHEMFAELADAISQGADLGPLTEAEG